MQHPRRCLLHSPAVESPISSSCAFWEISLWFQTGACHYLDGTKMPPFWKQQRKVKSRACPPEPRAGVARRAHAGEYNSISSSLFKKQQPLENVSLTGTDKGEKNSSGSRRWGGRGKEGSKGLGWNLRKRGGNDEKRGVNKKKGQRAKALNRSWQGLIQSFIPPSFKIRAGNISHWIVSLNAVKVWRQISFIAFCVAARTGPVADFHHLTRRNASRFKDFSPIPPACRSEVTPSVDRISDSNEVRWGLGSAERLSPGW